MFGEFLLLAGCKSTYYKTMRTLGKEKREILVLSRFQNLRYEEIGRILECEPGTVKVRVYRAVRQLEQIYNELAGEKAS